VSVLSRRKFFVGLGLAAAAPAIVRAISLMPVKSMASADQLQFLFNGQPIQLGQIFIVEGRKMIVTAMHTSSWSVAT